MADLLECNIKAPHEPHPWQNASEYRGFVTHMVPQYHYCRGVQWKNNEVYNHLHALIRKALNGTYVQGSGGLSVDEQMMEEIWPEIVGFLQPEDMPQTFTFAGDNLPEQDFVVTPGKIMEIPADPLTRIADAVEKIEKYMRPAPPDAYDPQGF